MSNYQRPALDLIGDLRRGKTAHDLTEKLHELIAACRDTGKKGDLILRLTVEPDPEIDSQMRVRDVITVKTPARTLRPSVFFVDDAGNLTRTDPNQTTFDGLRDAATPTPITREAN